MRTLVDGKAQRRALLHIGVDDIGARPRNGQRERQQQQPAARAVDHQSSRTARTAPMLVAVRALARAVSVASATSDAASTASASHGM